MAAYEQLAMIPPLYVTHDPVKRVVHVTGDTRAHLNHLQTIPGCRPVGRGKPGWYTADGFPQLAALRTAAAGDLRPADESGGRWLASMSSVASRVQMMRNGADELAPTVTQIIDMCNSKGWRSPFPMQVIGTLFLANRNHVILADEMGVGKTTQVAAALALYRTQGTLPALVVAPKSLLRNWVDELGYFGLTSTIVSGDAAKRRKLIDGFSTSGVDVLILPRSVLAKHTSIAGYGTVKLSDADRTAKELNKVPFRTVVAEEAHAFCDPNSIQTRALWSVSKNAHNRWAVTGTPVEQSPLQLWSLLHFVNPADWPSSVRFRDRWCSVTTDWFGYETVTGIRGGPVEEEYRAAISPYLLRRMRDAAKLPPKMYETRTCEMPADVARWCKQLEKQGLADVNGTVLSAEGPLAVQTRLLQLAQAPITVSESNEVRLCEPSFKLDLLTETVTEVRESGETGPLVLWFHSRQLLDLYLARKHAERVSAIHGDVSADARHDIVKSFQNGEIDQLALMYSTGAEGITLTRSRVNIRVEGDWSLTKSLQAEDRTHRYGAEVHDSILYIDLVTEGSLDETHPGRLAEKSRIAEESVRLAGSV